MVVNNRLVMDQSITTRIWVSQVCVQRYSDPRPAPACGFLNQAVPCALAVGEQWQRFAGDQLFEMAALLMGRKGRFVGKQLVEEKLGRIFLPASDQEQFDAG